MATGENKEVPKKDKVADHEEHIQDKGHERKDIRNAGEAGESMKTTEAATIKESVVAGEILKMINEAETKENVVSEKKLEEEAEKVGKAVADEVVKEEEEEKIEEAEKIGKAVADEVVNEEMKIVEAELKKNDDDEKLKEAEKEVSLEEKKKNDDVENKGGAYESGGVQKCSSLREDINSNLDLREYEKKALMELRSKIEKAIMENKLLKEDKGQVVGDAKEGIDKEIKVENAVKVEKSTEEKESEKDEETSKKVEQIEEMVEKKMENQAKGEANVVKYTEKEKEQSNEIEEIEATKPNKQEVDGKEKKPEAKIDTDIAIWGVPLLPSKGDDATDVILLKFLKAREFEVDEAFEMLRNTLQWRKEKNIDSVLDEQFGEVLGSISKMDGVDRERHPVCYSCFKLLGDEELYNKVVGTEENRETFIRSRVQLIERAIQKLDFKPGGVSSILLVNDLKDMPGGQSRKELRNATKQVVALLQDNYPEFVARNIFVSVPFWYYAYSASAILSPFMTPRTNSKFVFARPSRVTDVLLKYVASEELPVHYGGLKRENDTDFSTEDVVLEIYVNPSSTEIINIPVPQAGTTILWEVIVLGWEVNYREEFMPTDEGSYGIIVQRGRRIGVQEEGSVRNSFTNSKPGNIVLTIENGALIKRKRICYRYKIKNKT